MDQNQQAPNQPQENPVKQKNIGMAIVANIIFFVPFFTQAHKDPFVKFHMKQGAVLFIAGIVIAIVKSIPVIGLFAFILDIILLVLLIIGIMNAANGKEENLPIIGQYAKNFNF